MVKKMFVVFLFFALIGCETTGDPKKGGIFWSEDKAKQRQSDKQQNLNVAQQEASAVKADSIQLEKEKGLKAADLSKQKEQLNQMNLKIAAMEQDIKNVKSKTAAQEQQKKDAESQLVKLKRRLNAISNNSQLSFKEKEKEIESLNKQIEDVFNIIANL